MTDDSAFEEWTCEDLQNLSDWLFSHAERRRDISTGTTEEEREIEKREALAKKLKRMMIKKGCS